MYKIYKLGNYLIVDKLDSKFLAEVPLTDVEIIQLKSSVNVYEVKVGSKAIVNVHLSDIQDKNGDPYTELSWNNFRYNLTGFSNVITDPFLLKGAGYSHTGAFADKPISNNYVWQSGAGINITQDDVNSDSFKVFSLSRAVHEAVDNPYWSTPSPIGYMDNGSFVNTKQGVGLFQGENLPSGVTSLVDYDYVFDNNYDPNGSTGFEGSTGRIKLNDLQYGDQLRVRFDFNAIPQIANTTIEPALWYANRNDNDDITFTFPLTTQPIFFGTGTVANTYLNRVEISAWITSNEDVNALTLPAIKSDNPIIIQPLGLLITILR